MPDPGLLRCGAAARAATTARREQAVVVRCCNRGITRQDQGVEQVGTCLAWQQLRSLRAVAATGQVGAQGAQHTTHLGSLRCNVSHAS